MKKELQERLHKELKQVEKCLKEAQEKENGYRTRVGRGVPSSKPTYFGEMADRFLIRARARHFWVRWNMAVKALRRRRARLQKLLRSSTTSFSVEPTRELKYGSWELKNAFKKGNNDFDAENYFDAD